MGNNKTRIFDPSKDELARLYQFYSCSQIGKMHGVNPETVRKRLHEHGIAAQKNGPRRSFSPSRDVLESLYQKMSMRQIADSFGVGETVVWKRLQEYGIKLKDHEKGGHRLKVGRIFSEEHKRNISLSQRGKTGEKNHNWKGGISIENYRLRNSAEAREWRRMVLERANHSCECCGAKQDAVCDCCGTKIRLHVHHIKSFAKHPELRFDVSNGEALCPKCHHSRH